MTIKKWCLLLVIALLSSLSLFTNVPQVEAMSAYKTYTVDRNNRLAETNEAYEAMFMLRMLSDGSTLKSAKDLFIDSDDYLYIADTGNKRIVILNQDLTLLHSFGTDHLIKPLGITVVDDLIYVADYGYGNVATDLGAIYVYAFDKTKTLTFEAISLIHTYSTPSSPLLTQDGFIFRPMKIAVDANKTMYVVNEGTTSGVLMINENNRFINYFASNKVEITLGERIQRILYQNNESVYLTKNIPSPVLNIAADPSGYFYTVTQKQTTNSLGDNIKKVNIGGVNYFKDLMFVFTDIVDVTPGRVGNVYAVTSAGFIAEYDNQGNLLFLFGGKGTGLDKLGLFLSASAIAIDTNNNLYVLDDHSSRNSIQVFRQTPFAAQVHEALDLYNQARYIESIDVWNEVLRYNSMLDMAYRGKGLGHLMNEEYELALELFKIAHDKEHYSEALWELRNLWMMDHMSELLYGLFGIIVLLVLFGWWKKKTHVLSSIQEKIAPVLALPLIKETLFMFYFLKHPSDACYEVKAKNKVSMTSAWFVIALIFVLYILSILLTGFIFNNVIPEETILVKEALSLLLPILIFIIANYLMSSLMEGEGTFKATFINTIGAMMPIFILFPLAIVFSNFITYNESFLYTMTLSVMLGWMAILLFFNIKETHNYSVSQTIVNLLLTFLMMVILIVVLLMIYLMIAQVLGFGTDIIKEVILRE
ncbi:MAG: hypothetical protein U1C51_04315 [Candidatus Izemoplasmatales bacterium]|nr:hypothetical protein [Candidatus Izemoplasmatales bacterium]